MDFFQGQWGLMGLHYAKAVRDEEFSWDGLRTLHALCVAVPFPDVLEGEAPAELYRTLAQSMGSGARIDGARLASPMWEAARDNVCKWVRMLEEGGTAFVGPLAPIKTFAMEQEAALRAARSFGNGCAIC
jgi:hypothetical protein